MIKYFLGKKKTFAMKMTELFIALLPLRCVAQIDIITTSTQKQAQEKYLHKIKY